MKKFLILGLVAALVLGCLAGCGDKKPQGDESSTPTGGDNVGTTTVGGDSTTGATDDSTTDPNSTETGDSVTDPTVDFGNDVTFPNWDENDSTTTDWGGDYTTDGGNNTNGVTTTTQMQATTTGQAMPNVDTDAALAPFLNAKPKVTYMSSYDPTNPEWKNIKAITYDGANIGSNKTKVFAYIGFPEGASATNKVPAIVLVHGGGGHAFAEWVKIWNDRGYAAIAMDTTGFFPSEAGRGVAGRETDDVSKWWHYGLYGEFAEAGYTNAPNNDEMSSSAKPVDQQWMYHCIASTMVAHNILQADSRVDGSKIGITGISWGGIITSLAIGYDNEYAFAIPIYGSAHLDEAHSYQGRYFSEARTKQLWSAADRLNRVNFPVLWLCWAKDMPFSINSNSKSYMDTKKTGSVLSAKVNWNHSHGSGWAPKESYIFADSIVGNRGTVTKVVNEPTVKKNADGTYSVTMTIAPDAGATKITARAAYITSPLSYTSKDGGHPTMDQTWKAETCTVSADKTTLTVTLPKNAEDFYIHITTTTATDKYDVSSQLVQSIGG